MDRWEMIRLRGAAHSLTGARLTQLGNDGWQLLSVHTYQIFWGDVTDRSQVHVVAYLQRPSSLRYERSRAQWCAAFPKDGPDRLEAT